MMSPLRHNRFSVFAVAAACALVASSGVTRADSLVALPDMRASGATDDAIVSFTFDGTTYVVADGDLVLGTTTRWYIDPATGTETEWVEGDPIPAGVPTVGGTGTAKVADVGSLADNFLLRGGGRNDISSIDAIDFQVTLFPHASNIFFLFERGGNDNGIWQGINEDGSLRPAVTFLASQDYGDTGVSVGGQNAAGVAFLTDEPVIGVRIDASGHDTLSISTVAGETDSLVPLPDMTASGEADDAIISFTFEGTTYVVADGDLVLGTTTRWYIDPATGTETEWVEGDPIPAGVPTVGGTGTAKVGDVGSKGDNFFLRVGGGTNISSIDAIDFQVTLFPFATDIFFLFERGGNDNGTWQGINPDGSLRPPVPFLASVDYGDTGVPVNGQNAAGVVFRAVEPVIGVRITASGHDTLSISTVPEKVDTLAALSDMTSSGEPDDAIISFTFDGTTYVVADGDLVLGTTTRWYIDPATGVETEWVEGDPIPAGVPTVGGTGTAKVGDVGSKGDNFFLRVGGGTNISSIDAIDFQVTLFPFPSDLFFLFERGGNDNGTWQGINEDGSLRDPVPFLASVDYGDTGVPVNGQNAAGVAFQTFEPVIGVRINASGHDTLSISTVPPPDAVDEVTFETEALVAAVGDPDGTLTVTVPRSCTAVGPLDVVITSDNMASVNPVGSPDGTMTVSFAQGEITRTINLSHGDAGTAVVSVSDAGTCPTGATSSATITVHPLEAILVQTSLAMEVGDVQAAAATGQFGPIAVDVRRDLTARVNWSTTDVSGSGVLSNVGNVVTAESLGEGQVVATLDGFTGSANIVVAENVTKIAFIAGTPILNGADQAAVDHLKALRFNATTGLLDPSGLPPGVSIFDDDDFNEVDIDDGMDLVIASSTIDSADIGGKFRCLSIPMIYWESALNRLDREGMTDAGGSVDNEFGDLFLDVPGGGPGHASGILAGFVPDMEGFLLVFDPPLQTFSLARGGIAPGVDVLAENGSTVGDFAVMVAEVGGLRVDGISIFLGRRVFLFLGDNSFDNLLADGLTIFDRSVDWALGGNRLQSVTQRIDITAKRTSICSPGMDFIEVSTMEQLTVTGIGGGCPIDLTASSTGTLYQVVSGNSVVSVDAEGLVTALADGAAVVRATNGGLTADFNLEVAATPPISGFVVEYYGPGLNPRAGPLPEAVEQIASLAPSTVIIDEVINYVDSDTAGGGDDREILGGSEFPGDRPADEDDFIIHAFGRLIFPNTDPVTLRVRSSDGFGLWIDGVLVMACSCDRGNTHTEVTYTPPVAGALSVELIHWERNVGASLEFTQVIDGSEVLVNDPNDMRALRAIAGGCLQAIEEEPGDPPALVSDDTAISVLGCGFTDATFETNEDVTVGNVTTTMSDGSAGPVVTVSSGSLQISLDAPLPFYEWLRVDVEVTGQTSNLSTTLTVFMAHTPLDINGDGRTNIADATAFGAEFNGGKDPNLIDVNCDGTVDIRDATAFGTTWNVGAANSGPLPPKP